MMTQQFLLKIELEFLLRKTTPRLNFKFDPGILHTYPEPGLSFVERDEMVKGGIEERVVRKVEQNMKC